MNKLKEREENLINLFLMLPDEFDQCDYLIQKALSQNTDYSKTVRTKENEIAGCKSKLWVKIMEKEGIVQVQSDSDSLILKGFAMLICDLFNGLSVKEVTSTPIDILEKLELNDEINAIRKEGIRKMIMRIQGKENVE